MKWSIEILTVLSSILVMVGLVDLLRSGIALEHLDEIGQIRGWYMVVHPDRGYPTPVWIVGSLPPLESAAVTNPTFHYLIIGCWVIGRFIRRFRTGALLAIVFLIAGAVFQLLPPFDFGRPEFPGFTATFDSVGERGHLWYHFHGPSSDRLAGTCHTIRYTSQESVDYLCRLRPDTSWMSTELSLFAAEIRAIVCLTVGLMLSV